MSALLLCSFNSEIMLGAYNAKIVFQNLIVENIQNKSNNPNISRQSSAIKNNKRKYLSFLNY